MTEDQFLQKLLSDTKNVFEQSPIFKLQRPIKRSKGLLLGINWGADGDPYRNSLDIQQLII